MKNNKIFKHAPNALLSTLLCLGIALMSGQVSAGEELLHNWVKSETHAIGEGLVEYATVSYDSKGKRTSHKVYAPNKKLDGETRYTYNAKNQVVKFEDLSKRGKLEAYATISYNSAGKPAQEEIFNKKGKLDGKEVYKYDSKGKLIGADLYQGNDKFGTITISEHHQGKPKRGDIRQLSSKKIEISVIYEYDSKLRLVSESLYPEGQLSGDPFVQIKYSY